MLAVFCVFEYTFLLMQCFESKGIVLVNVRFFHGNDLPVLVHLPEPRWLDRMNDRVLPKLNHCQWIETLESFFLTLHFIVIFFIVQVWQKVTAWEVFVFIVMHTQVIWRTQCHLNQIRVRPKRWNSIYACLNFAEYVVRLSAILRKLYAVVRWAYRYKVADWVSEVTLLDDVPCNQRALRQANNVELLITEDMVLF